MIISSRPTKNQSLRNGGRLRMAIKNVWHDGGYLISDSRSPTGKSIVVRTDGNSTRHYYVAMRTGSGYRRGRKLTGTELAWNHPYGVAKRVTDGRKRVLKLRKKRIKRRRR
jgi:hypothetical protein